MHLLRSNWLCNNLNEIYQLEILIFEPGLSKVASHDKERVTELTGTRSFRNGGVINFRLNVIHTAILMVFLNIMLNKIPEIVSVR